MALSKAWVRFHADPKITSLEKCGIQNVDRIARTDDQQHQMNGYVFKHT